MSAEKPKVIINGDDFGYSPGINEGIIQAYENGILTSTTVMGNILTGKEKLNGLVSKKVAKLPIGIGVHLNLTHGNPLTNYPFPELPFNRPARNQPDQEWTNAAWEEYLAQFGEFLFSVNSEFIAQFNAVRAQLGPIDHLDSHHSVASFKPISDIYTGEARDRNLPVRPLAKLTTSPRFSGEYVMHPLEATAIRVSGVKTVDRVDMRLFHQRPDPKALFYGALRSVNPGEVVEFMFHPSVDNSKGDWRVTDLKLLTDPETIKVIKELDIQLTTYAEAAY